MEIQLTDLITGTIAFSDEIRNFYFISDRNPEPLKILSDIPCCIYPFYQKTSPYQNEYLPLKHVQENIVTGNYEYELYLVSPYKENPLKINWDFEQWGNDFYGWFDSQSMLLASEKMPFGSVVLLNPFSGEIQQLSTTYPDLFDRIDYSQWNPSSVVYNPVYARAVVLSRAPYSIVLVDLNTNQELWRYEDPLVVNHQPVWLPNGEGFIVTKPVHNKPEYSWVSYVSKDGEERLVLQNEIYTDVYGFFTMSPNGEFISYLWEEENDKSIRHLKFLQIESGEITDTKINIDFDEGYYYLWSPNSNYLLAQSGDAAYLYSVSTYEVNKFERLGHMLLAWLNNSP
jgi:hypothetical protein